VLILPVFLYIVYEVVGAKSGSAYKFFYMLWG